MMSNDPAMQVFSDHYSTELLRNLQRQYAASMFCDVRLQLAETCIVKAHRNVLSASSSYFCAMFSGGLKEATSETVNLQHIAASDILENLISFIYTGTVLSVS
jgi:actin-binding protein IPP